MIDALLTGTRGLQGDSTGRTYNVHPAELRPSPRCKSTSVTRHAIVRFDILFFACIGITFACLQTAI
eukprot:m.238342 g.238342  ORF g.238342 m.238342 type:complete len:67 (-) comp19388_c0_seq7:802-1002(-)